MTIKKTKRKMLDINGNAVRFVQFPYSALEDHRLNANDKATLLAILYYDPSCPSYLGIGKLAGLRRTAVINAISRLEIYGHISIHKVLGKRNHYSLIIKDPSVSRTRPVRNTDPTRPLNVPVPVRNTDPTRPLNVPVPVRNTDPNYIKNNYTNKTRLINQRDESELSLEAMESEEAKQRIKKLLGGSRPMPKP